MKNFLLQQRQFLLYCLIGLSGVALDLGVYLLLVKTKAINLDYQVANAVGYASGTLLSFVLNARFNFRVADKIALRLAIFFSVALLGWLLSAALLQLLVGHYGLGKVISKLTTILVVLLLQYNLNRLFSFRKAR